MRAKRAKAILLYARDAMCGRGDVSDDLSNCRQYNIRNLRRRGLMLVKWTAEL